MAFEPPWILAPAFLEQLADSGLDSDQAVQAIREIIRSTKRMPPWAPGVGPAQPPSVRYALPEVARLDRPLNCETLDISTSTIEAVGKMYGAPMSNLPSWNDLRPMPDIFRARVEFWAADAKRLFPPTLVLEAFRLMQEGWTKHAAATAVAPRAGGNSIEAAVKRITRALDKMIAGMSNECPTDVQ